MCPVRCVTYVSGRSVVYSPGLLIMPLLSPEFVAQITGLTNHFNPHFEVLELL
jgi:hypothetical protein